MFQKANDEMYKIYGCVDWDMSYYCWDNGFWSMEATYDDEGNFLDAYPIITVEDFCSACEELGIDPWKCL